MRTLQRAAIAFFALSLVFGVSSASAQGASVPVGLAAGALMYLLLVGLVLTAAWIDDGIDGVRDAMSWIWGDA